MTDTTYNFIEHIIDGDLKSGKRTTVHTRFPPEPNGYLHIGHAKSICLNFGLANTFGGKANLRFDDTNPLKEDQEYVDAIREDVKWLGFDWDDREFYTSDYFDQLHAWAVQLIEAGHAYVDDSTQEAISEMRGVPTKPGTESPFRNRAVKENLELFEGMKNGDFEIGSKVLRAKIDMSSPNMHMRDPILYRILNAPHHRTGDKWNIYPMYDFAHGLSDSIEGITHSVCTLEFEVHRPLYDWLLEKLEIFHPQQIEFARLNLSYTIMSKRKLLQLVEENHVNGWDDPRMPTVSGMRRRGYPAEAIRNFADRVGIARRENVIDFALLEFSVREVLNKTTPRLMGVLDPIKVTISNYPEGQVEEMEAVNNPEDSEGGTRIIPFSGELYIERGDFMEDPPKKYFRLSPGKVVRLKNGYIIQCDEVVKTESGEIDELICSYFPDSRSGSDTSGIKAKGVIHWVSRAHAVDVEVRQYDRLFMDENPDGHKAEGKSFLDFINPDSLSVIPAAKAEPAVKDSPAGLSFQFMRKGYFVIDKDSSSDKIIVNQTVGLRDSWAKKNK